YGVGLLNSSPSIDESKSPRSSPASSIRFVVPSWLLVPRRIESVLSSPVAGDPRFDGIRPGSENRESGTWPCEVCPRFCPAGAFDRLLLGVGNCPDPFCRFPGDVDRDGLVVAGAV